MAKRPDCLRAWFLRRINRLLVWREAHLTKTQRTFFRVAGEVILSGGLCIFFASSALFGQTTSSKTAPQSASHKTAAVSAHKTTTPCKSCPPAKSTKKRSSSSSRSNRTRTQMAPTEDRIQEIQAALAKSGSYQGDPTGKWDDSTVEAMKHFQQSNGLAPTGKLDALSLQKLGLGSAIAGRGAPRPVTHPPAVGTPTASIPR